MKESHKKSKEVLNRKLESNPIWRFVKVLLIFFGILLAAASSFGAVSSIVNCGHPANAQSKIMASYWSEIATKKEKEYQRKLDAEQARKDAAAAQTPCVVQDLKFSGTLVLVLAAIFSSYYLIRWIIRYIVFGKVEE